MRSLIILTVLAFVAVAYNGLVEGSRIELHELPRIPREAEPGNRPVYVPPPRPPHPRLRREAEPSNRPVYVPPPRPPHPRLRREAEPEGVRATS